MIIPIIAKENIPNPEERLRQTSGTTISLKLNLIEDILDKDSSDDSGSSSNVYIRRR